MGTVTTRDFKFGAFEIDAGKRLLLKNGQPVALNSKTFDVLLALVERHGQVLAREDIFERVWPGQFVEEGNLTVQISALRKIFGENKGNHRFIVTVPGRGYSFVADVDENQNGDLVIERHSLSRIVIDEAITDLKPVVPLTSRQDHLLRNVLIIALVLVSLIGIGYSIFRVGSRSSYTGFGEMQIKRLTTNGKVSFAALSPDGKLFAYALKELEQNSLWLGFVEGGSDVMLRPAETGRYNDLAFSADGTAVLFTFSGADSRESVLYRIPAFGGAREKIRPHVVSFAVSPDGKRYAFARNDAATKTQKLILASFDGSEERELISLENIRSIGSESISWSPEGASIAIAASGDGGNGFDEAFIVQVADGSLRRITNHGWKEIIKTAWIDDGSALLLVAEDKSSNTSVSYSQIWHVALPGGNAKQLTSDLSSYRSVLNSADRSFLTVELRQMNNIWVAPSDDLSAIRQVTFGTFGRYDGLWGLDWMTDGRIVFTSTDNKSQVISAMNADGSNIKQLTSPGYTDSWVNTSNDGRYIVFQSTRAGGSDIWRMGADGSDVVRLTSDGKSNQPFISPDSHFVYYRSSGENSGGMHRIAIEGGEPEKLTDTEVAFISLSPDGKFAAAATGSRLAVFPSTGGEPVKIFELTRFGTLTLNTRWSPDGRSIAYRDRGYGYWVQPVAGGEPQRLVGLPMEKFYNFAWSKDGKQFAFVRGQEIRDVVLFRRSH